jgi:plastocyanin
MSWLLIAMLQGQCTIEGTVVLLKDGKERPPDNEVVVYVEKSSVILPPKPPVEAAKISQVNLQFEPRLKVIVESTSVDFPNLDHETHSVFARESTNGDVIDNVANAKANTVNRPFMNAGHVVIQCDLHKRMRADVLVLKNDRFAVPDAAGKFRIPELPFGDYTIKIWETNRAYREIEVKACRGRRELGVVRLKAAPELVLRRRNGSLYPDYDN